MDYQNILTEIRYHENSISNVTKEIESIDIKINDLIRKIDDKFLSISIEAVLLSLPNKAVGSRNYAKHLNSQSELYQDIQFNKIIRFLSLLEEIEDDYNESYYKVGVTYLINPIKKDAENLTSKYTLLNNEYKLMDVLVNAVKSDKVLFNKIYNLLEDRGIFMTEYDKSNYYNLSTIASNIVTLVDQSFQISQHLSNINYELWETNSKLGDINESLGNIDAGVKAGNLLSTVQTYQLYKINKNTKLLNR